MIHSPERVEAIRSRAVAGVESISALTAKIADAGIRGQLKQIRYTVDDVQTFFLNSLQRESRTPEAESTWLSHAEMVLHLAELQLKTLIQNIAPYGPNVKSVGG